LCRFISALVVLAAAVCALYSPGSSARAVREQPTIAKDTLQMTAFTFGSYKGNYDV
jgi:hypothetical protein